MLSYVRRNDLMHTLLAEGMAPAHENPLLIKAFATFVPLVVNKSVW